MFNIPGPLGTLADFLVIVIGFGSIIFVHELGHFVAAKWAGIRVLAFSIGFGNVLCSYRKGIGFCKGSSERRYIDLVNSQAAGSTTSEGEVNTHHDVSPTEYRLSMLPLGGYVKMLGQEDINPEAVSNEPDSYQNCSVGKRMVVISAGVIMNVITAALLFVIVFTVGRDVFPAQVGYVMDDSPASQAIAVNHPEIIGGLQRGDRITQINGWKMHSFEHILPEIAMASKTNPSKIYVVRDGVEGLIEFETIPVLSDRTGLLDLGISPSITSTLKGISNPEDRKFWDIASHQLGLDGLEPSDVFVEANGQAIHSPFDLLDIAEVSEGKPINAIIKRGDQTINHVLLPVPGLQNDVLQAESGDPSTVLHLLGLSGVMMVNPNTKIVKEGLDLEPGDIFARIGTLDFPSVAEGINHVKSNPGKPMDIVVLRRDADGQYQRVKLTVDVARDGTIGFYPSMTTTSSNFLSTPMRIEREREPENGNKSKTELIELPASNLVSYPGSRITMVGDIQISTIRDVHKAITDLTSNAFDSGDEAFTLPVTLELPLPIQPDGSIPTSTTQWTLTRADIQEVRDLGWTLPGSMDLVSMFEVKIINDKAEGPINAITRGVSESRRVMMQTYITFLRLFQGSVKVEHLKGPVGIAHLGTQIASQGWVWVLFFMALISINLAVINFLPLPIVDGGQFLMLIYEGIRGKPVSIMFQNITTLAGLLLIGTMFLFVTFNDVKSLLGM